MPRVFNTIQEAIDDALFQNNVSPIIYVEPGEYSINEPIRVAVPIICCGGDPRNRKPEEYDYIIRQESP